MQASREANRDAAKAILANGDVHELAMLAEILIAKGYRDYANRQPVLLALRDSVAKGKDDHADRLCIMAVGNTLSILSMFQKSSALSGYSYSRESIDRIVSMRDSIGQHSVASELRGVPVATQEQARTAVENAVYKIIAREISERVGLDEKVMTQTISSLCAVLRAATYVEKSFRSTVASPMGMRIESASHAFPRHCKKLSEAVELLAAMPTRGKMLFGVTYNDITP
jgi:hypothetical protein